MTAESAEPAGLTVGDRLSCGCPVAQRHIPCAWHRKIGGPLVGCRYCKFNVVGAWHNRATCRAVARASASVNGKKGNA